MDLLTFPRYNPNDIITHIRNQILTGSEAKNLSKNDLFPNPKPEVLHMIFMRTLQNVYGIRLEHFYMMPVNADIMYPQIVEGFLPIFLLCSSFPIMGHIETKTLILCYSSLLEAKRTARFLSGILNFIHFQESRREIYMEFQWAYKSALEKIQQLQTANQEAAVKLEKLDTIPVEQKAEFKQLSDDIQELQQVLNQDYRQKTVSLQEVTSQKKAEVAERTRSLNQLKVTMATLKEEQEQLESKIVESPEELKNYKEHMKETVQKLKKTKVRNLEDQIENGQIELKNAATDEMSLKRLVNAKREKLSTAEIRIKKKHEDVEQYKRTVFEYCNRVQEKRGAVYEKVTAIHKEIQQVRLKVQQLNENTEKEKMKAQEIYLNLRAGLEKYHEALAKIAESYAASRDEKTTS
uniref:Kinetochore protein Nuf2 N-terminal domain-containing protein n=1 Tax=Terrapene triunguis TaxID=2587831 RepID=A0A674IUN1_9SAUR